MAAAGWPAHVAASRSHGILAPPPNARDSFTTLPFSPTPPLVSSCDAPDPDASRPAHRAGTGTTRGFGLPPIVVGPTAPRFTVSLRVAVSTTSGGS